MHKLLFNNLKNKVIKKFLHETNPDLHYHNQCHTLDVLNHVVKIAKREGITSPEKITMLKIAALYHDIGCLYGHKNHEERGCEIMREDLKKYNYPEEKLGTICRLILATKIPQVPETQLEQIICDADIDYLGRKDFPVFSDCLRKEFLAFGIVRDEKHWQETQIRFFESHHYFTASSKKLRNPKKLAYLTELKKEYEKIKE